LDRQVGTDRQTDRPTDRRVNNQNLNASCTKSMQGNQVSISLCRETRGGNFLKRGNHIHVESFSYWSIIFEVSQRKGEANESPPVDDCKRPGNHPKTIAERRIAYLGTMPLYVSLDSALYHLVLDLLLLLLACTTPWWLLELLLPLLPLLLLPLLLWEEEEEEAEEVAVSLW